MKKNSFILIFFAVTCVFFSCTEEVQKPPVTLEKNVTAKPENTMKTVKQEWPYLKTDAGTEVAISENLTAKNYILIFDGSGSMGETKCGGGRQKITVAKEAVMEWAKSLPGEANLGLVAFYYDKWAVLPLMAGGRESFTQEIQKVAAGGRTPLTEAIVQAYNAITKEGRKQLGYGNYTIVVVTDGIANNSVALSGAVTKILNQSPVNIYTIGFCIGKTHSLNQPGRTVYKSADNPEELKKGLSEVLAESDTFDESDFN